MSFLLVSTHLQFNIVDSRIFSELILRFCVHNFDYLKMSYICTHVFCLFSTMPIFSLHFSYKTYKSQLPPCRFLMPRDKDFCLDLESI